MWRCILKIVGVVNEYKQALEIEDIVKVFLIEKRINNILSLEKSRKLENENSDLMIFSKENDENVNHFNNEKIVIKKNEDSKPVFNVRGLF